VENWNLSTFHSSGAEKQRNETEGRGESFPSTTRCATFVRVFMFVARVCAHDVAS